MTHNQIDYWNLQESKRHNLSVESEATRHNVAGESETNRHNTATENITISELREQSRHNLAAEAESKRHNTVTEQQTAISQAEQVRHNAVSEYHQAVDLNITAAKDAEQARHNVAAETETQRHNIQTEKLDAAKLAFDKQYKATMADIERFKNATNASVSSAQAREIDAKIKKMQEDIKNAQTSNTIKGWDTATDAVTSLGQLILKFIK